MNVIKNNSEVNGIQDDKNKDNFYGLDDKQFVFSDHESGMVSNYSKPSLSAITIASS